MMKKDGLTNKEERILDKVLDEIYPDKKRGMKQLKILKIERCNHCKFFNFEPGEKGKMNRFQCCNPNTVRKNGNYRIINRDTAMKGKITNWCGLEDYPV